MLQDVSLYWGVGTFLIIGDHKNIWITKTIFVTSLPPPFPPYPPLSPPIQCLPEAVITLKISRYADTHRTVLKLFSFALEGTRRITILFFFYLRICAKIVITL
jgi:hypothetical protein